MPKDPLRDLRKLPVARRIQLVEALWDSIAEDTPGLPLSDEQKTELERRLAEAVANPGQGKSWSEVKKRLLGSS